MRLLSILEGALPLAEMKSVRVPTSPWFAMSPEVLAYFLLGALVLIIVYVFFR